MTLGLREQHKYQNFRNLITINCKWRGDCITDGYVSFAEYVVRASWYFWEEYLLPIFKSSRYSVIFLRFTFQLLSFCDLWSECGSQVTGLRKIIWDLLFLSYSSNLMFVAIVPTALALIIFVSLSWVKNWAIKSQCHKNKGIYPWFKSDETCLTAIAKYTKVRSYYYLCVEYFSQLSFDSEMYTKSAAVADFVYISESNESWEKH